MEKPYEPSKKATEVVSRVIKRYDDMRTWRNDPRRCFDGRTLESYVNDNVDAWNGIVPDDIRSTKDEWQSLIVDNKTRGKIKAVVALVVASRPYLGIIGEEQKWNKDAPMIKRIYDDTYKAEYGSYKLYLQALSALIKGTVIVEELFEKQSKKVKEITGVNLDTGKVSFSEKKVTDKGFCRSKIVPILNFYPNENYAEIKEDCIVVENLSMDRFANKYGSYENAEYVKAGVSLHDVERMVYKTIEPDPTKLVQTIKYYNEILDEFIILANGIWINAQDGESICPIPYNHKRLPFTKMVHELADEEEFYGKAFPDLMAGEQETINAILRMMIDQEVLSIHKPIVLGEGTEMESYQLYPGKTYKTTGDVTQIKELGLTGASQSSFSLINFLEQRADVNTSVDTAAQGVGGTTRRTAREVIVLDENAKRMSGTFQKHLYKLLFDRAELRVPNIQQFYIMPIGKTELKDRDDQVVTTGSGDPIMRDKYREIATSIPGKGVKYFEIDPKALEGKFMIRYEEDFETPMTRSQRMQIAQAVLDESKQNPLLDADKATIEWLVGMGKDPEDLYIKPQPQQAQPQPQPQPQAQAPVKPQPKTGLSLKIR